MADVNHLPFVVEPTCCHTELPAQKGSQTGLFMWIALGSKGLLDIVPKLDASSLRTSVPRSAVRSVRPIVL